MASYFILAQSQITARALGTWLELNGEPPLSPAREAVRDARCEVVTVVPECVVEDFARISGRLGEILAEARDRRLTVLVDTVRPASLNPLATPGGWDCLIALLILALPEVRWIFGLRLGELAKEPEVQWEWHSLAALLALPWRDPLFDPTGLRSFVRAGSKEDLPMRRQRAAAIDEEEQYSLTHAYTAYRFGYAADAVRSWALMKALFDDADETRHAHDFDLLLEDVNLNFPDREPHIHLSSLSPVGDGGRARHCRLLHPEKEKSQFRILISSGHTTLVGAGPGENEAFLRRYKPTGAGFVLKPVGGMFELWEKAGLFARPHVHDGLERNSAPGFAAGFCWPPRLVQHDGSAETGGHSAPGRLMLVAQHLTDRAEALQSAGGGSAATSVVGAVLSTDAVEILRFRTPTLALQALNLKHAFEVRTEVDFLGVGHHFDLQHRFDELERDTHNAARFFHARRHRSAQLDALVSIANRIMLIFREAGQFDEEAACLVRLRWWHRLLRFRSTRNPIVLAGYAGLAYGEFLLSSARRFVAMLLVWYGIFFLVAYLIGPIGDTCQDPVIDAASYAWNTFISNNPSEAHGLGHHLLNVVATVVGVFHLGVLISYLYSAVTRK